MTIKRWLSLGGVAVLALAVLGMAALNVSPSLGQSVAQAQAAATAAPTAAPKPTTSPSTATNTIGATFWQGLAAKLGVSVDTLKSDALQVRKDMLNQAVKDGKLTQDQANQIEQKLNADNLIAPIPIGRANGPKPGNGTPGPNKRGFPHRGVVGVGGSTAVLEAVAKSVNLSPSDLVSQLRSGKTLADVAKAQNVDQAKVKQAIIDARTAEIQRQVTDGLITQTQADSLKSRLTPDNIDLTQSRFFWK